MKTHIIITFFAVAAVSCSNDDNKQNLNTTDQNFVNQAMMANQTEIQFGKLASKRSADNMVTKFANRMQQEHGEALTDLQHIANNYGNVTVSNNAADSI